MASTTASARSAPNPGHCCNRRAEIKRIVNPAINATDLFSAQIFGGDERNLSGMDGTGYVGHTAVSKDGKWIVYTVQINSQYDLRVSDGNPAQPPTPTPSPSPTPLVTPTPTATTPPTMHKVYVPVVAR